MRSTTSYALSSELAGSRCTSRLLAWRWRLVSQHLLPAFLVLSSTYRNNPLHGTRTINWCLQYLSKHLN